MARKILLADDSVTAQNMGRKILSDAGYDVVTVNNGSAALKRVAEQKPDLIVLDVYMPGYSGLEVCQRLKDSPETSAIPILLTVGKLEPFKPEEARRVRAEAYIIKPFEASELLSALTRLEDQVVPGQSGSEADPETGWKSRLRFPSKKKKEEPEPETDGDLMGGPTFRDFRRGRGKAREASPSKSVPPAPTVIPDIPRDITPEELDALSAVAAKLDGEIVPAASAGPAVADVPAAASPVPAEEKKEFEVTAPASEQRPAETAAAPAETAVAPPEEAKPAAAVPAAEAAPALAETTPPAPPPVHVEALAEKEPSPVDRGDEPFFASAPVAAPEATPAAQEVPAAAVEPAAASSSEPASVEAKTETPKAEEPPVEEKPATAATTENAPRVEETLPAAAAREAQEEPERPAPSEEELAEALRLLTPSVVAADSASVPSRDTLVAAGAILAEEAAKNATAVSRWMAESVAVSPEEAALSLEAEMFKDLSGGAPSNGSAPADLPAAAKSDPTVPADAAALSAEAPADRALAATPVVAGEPAASSPGAASRDSQEKAEAAAPQVQVEDEPAPVTFADAVRQEDEAPEAAASSVPAAAAESARVVPGAETVVAATSEAAAGGEEEMSKERGKSGKSNWHQIRAGAPAPSSSDVVEAAKQADATTEAAPKAMAAAAAAEGAPGKPDPNAIASIVDSVLADLRPKIVEEIAKKLAGK